MGLTWILFTLIILATANAFLNYFLNFCMKDGNIFDFYRKWVENTFSNYPKLGKAMGKCIICFGTWVSIFLFLFYSTILGIPLYLIIFYVPLSSFVTMKLFRL